MRLLYFTAAWCQPCKKFGPLLEKESGDRGIRVDRIDIDQEPQLALAFSVMSVPTVVALGPGGKILNQFGYLPPSALRARLDMLMDDHDEDAA